MPDNKLEQFVDTLHEVDGDDEILKSINAKGLLKQGGEFLSNTFHDWTHKEKPVETAPKAPETPSGLTPTYQESAFLSKGHETSLYNVTNREDKIPEVSTKSNLFSHVKYRVKGLNLTAEVGNNNTKYTFFAGKRIGAGKVIQEGSVRTEIKAFYKVSMHHVGSATAEYSVDTPGAYNRASIYCNDTALGVSYNFSNKRGFNSAFSADTESASLRLGYDGKSGGANVEVEGFFTTGYKYSNPCFGASGRISF